MTGFDALDVSIEMVRASAPAVAKVRSQDRSLADQTQRALQSVPLCIAEGRKRVGRDRKHLFKIAAGSGEEARTALQIARAWGYVDDAVLAKPLELVDRVQAMLWRLGE